MCQSMHKATTSLLMNSHYMREIVCIFSAIDPCQLRTIQNDVGKLAKHACNQVLRWSRDESDVHSV